MIGVTAIALIFAAHTVFATGAESAQAHDGRWLVPGEPKPYAIDSKGIVGALLHKASTRRP